MKQVLYWCYIDRFVWGTWESPSQCESIKHCGTGATKIGRTCTIEVREEMNGVLIFLNAVIQKAAHWGTSRPEISEKSEVAQHLLTFIYSFLFICVYVFYYFFY